MFSYRWQVTFATIALFLVVGVLMPKSALAARLNQQGFLYGYGDTYQGIGQCVNDSAVCIDYIQQINEILTIGWHADGIHWDKYDIIVADNTRGTQWQNEVDGGTSYSITAPGTDSYSFQIQGCLNPDFTVPSRCFDFTPWVSVMGHFTPIEQEAAHPLSKYNLGSPNHIEQDTPQVVGRFQTYQNDAAVYWSPSTGAHEIHGLIGVKWGQLGWENSFLGFPTTDEMLTPNKPGAYSFFQGGYGGAIYWSPSTGAHEVHGAIIAKWAQLHYENSFLGFPTTDEEGLADGGRVSYFQGGYITWDNNVATVYRY